jgi:hypothetical protein
MTHPRMYIGFYCYLLLVYVWRILCVSVEMMFQLPKYLDVSHIGFGYRDLFWMYMIWHDCSLVLFCVCYPYVRLSVSVSRSAVILTQPYPTFWPSAKVGVLWSLPSYRFWMDSVAAALSSCKLSMVATHRPYIHTYYHHSGNCRVLHRVKPTCRCGRRLSMKYSGQTGSPTNEIRRCDGSHRQRGVIYVLLVSWTLAETYGWLVY